MGKKKKDFSCAVSEGFPLEDFDFSNCKETYLIGDVFSNALPNASIIFDTSVVPLFIFGQMYADELLQKHINNFDILVKGNTKALIHLNKLKRWNEVCNSWLLYESEYYQIMNVGITLTVYTESHNWNRIVGFLNNNGKYISGFIDHFFEDLNMEFLKSEENYSAIKDSIAKDFTQILENKLLKRYKITTNCNANDETHSRLVIKHMEQVKERRNPYVIDSVGKGDVAILQEGFSIARRNPNIKVFIINRDVHFNFLENRIQYVRGIPEYIRKMGFLHVFDIKKS